MHAYCNASRLGLELDLSNPAGREVFWDLVRWADVLVESFSAGALERMGFGYPKLAEANPGLILLSSCLPGQTGTLELPGYGNLSTGLFGFTTTTRWPGRPAAGPFGAYTDVVSPRFGLAAVLAALDHRRRTGLGQHLDLSQAEASLHFLSPALLDAELNGNEATARGNTDLEHAPHGVYPVMGTDAWIAVVCTDDDAWRNLARLLGRADLADLDTAQRLDRRDELDELVAAFTAGHDGEVLQEQLQALGIGAHQVQNSHECLRDPQLAHRGHYVTVEHPLLGPVVMEGPRFRLSRTPGVTRPAPTYGQHAAEVLHDFLGYDDDRIAELAAAGALGA
jgi:benzylsuccinate CoA-transferase BbsF subunit